MRTLKAAVFAAVLASGALLSMGQTQIIPSRWYNPFVRVGDGTAAAPSYSFANRTNYGIFSTGSFLGFSITGSELYEMNATGFDIYSGKLLRMASSGTTPDTFLGSSDAGKITLTGTTPMFQLGGTTASFPALDNSGALLRARLADGSGFAAFQAAAITATNGFAMNTAGTSFTIGGVKLIINTAPSSPSSCGTSPAVSNSNGTAAFVITGGTGGTATGCTITMPAAATGWNCSITNITQTAAHRADRTTVQTASTTTSVTWEYQIVSTGAATAFTASDVFRGVCFAY